MKLSFAAFLIVFGSLTVEARKPAVEDFVGIEQQTPDVTPSGTETLFNFAEEVKDLKSKPTQPVVNYKQAEVTTTAPSTGWSFSVWFGVGFVLALPMITWTAMAQHLKKRELALQTAVPSNVTDLAARRAEKQVASEEQEKFKKVS